MRTVSYDPQFAQEKGRSEGERRKRERRKDGNDIQDVEFFPLPNSGLSNGRVFFLDESGHPYLIRNSAGEDTALMLSRRSYVIAQPNEKIIYGPRRDSVFYAGQISTHIADVNNLCAVTFGRMPFPNANLARLGEKIRPSQLLDLISKNNMWAEIRKLWASGRLKPQDILLLDGTLNVVQTPHTATADEIARDLYQSNVILVGLSKRFAPKCGDIVRAGREQFPNQPFIFTIPPEKLLGSHTGADENQMIFTLGPKGRTVGLTFGIALSNDPNDLEYHGLYINYYNNQPHLQAVQKAWEQREAVKIYDPITLSTDFVSEVLIPVGMRLVQYTSNVVCPSYPLPAGAAHAHVVIPESELHQIIYATISGILESGETIHSIESDTTIPLSDKT